MIYSRAMVPVLLCAGLLCAWMTPARVVAGELPDAPAAVTIAPALHWPATPIASRAQLDAYLRDTPAAASPLSAFTAPGQRRFLASLVFHERGLGGFGTDDLIYDLTRAQAWDVLRLFGKQGYAADLAARTRPRPPDGQPATLEAAYDRLAAVQERDPNDPALGTLYAASFAPAQARLATLGDRDLELLFRATALLRSTAAPVYLADMRRDYAELERRKRVDRPHADALYDALLAAHRTDDARALLATRPSLDRQPPPTLHTVARLRPGRASVWVAADRRALWRLPLMLRDKAQVIVLGSPHCHFSEAAARDIAADPALRRLFRSHAQWVAPASDIVDFEAMTAWNRSYPEQKLAIAYDNAELSFVSDLRTPVFYFLRHGELVGTLIGWPGPQQRGPLRQRLQDIGLLAPGSKP